MRIGRWRGGGSRGQLEADQGSEGIEAVLFTAPVSWPKARTVGASLWKLAAGGPASARRQSRGMSRWLGFLGALTLSLVSAGAEEPPASVWQDVAWTDLAGRQWTRAELEGRVVLLDFWATWCAPCLAELPHLEELHERYADRGFVLLGVALDTLDRRRLRSFLHRHDVRWPQVHESRGTDGEAARAFGVEAVPSTVLVDRSGRVVARGFRGPALAAAVDALLGLHLD